MVYKGEPGGVAIYLQEADLVKANITSEATPSATKSAPGTEVVS